MNDADTGSEHNAEAWRTQSGDVLHVGVRVRRPFRAILILGFAAIPIGIAVICALPLAPPSVGKWVAFGACTLIGIAALHFALWLAFGKCELAFSPHEMILRQRSPLFTSTKRVALSDIRKVERVEQVNANNGKRIATVFYVFGPSRLSWTFGYNLTAPAADHLWAALSRGRKSPTRFEKITPSSD